MKKRALILITFALLGCNNATDAFLFLNKKPLIMKFENDIRLDGERLNIDNFGATNLFVIDTFLIFQTPKLDKLYTVFSTRSFENCGSYISRGQGVSEFIMCLSPMFVELKEKDNIVSFYDYTKHRIIKWNLSKTIKQKENIFEEPQQIDFQKGIYKIFHLNDTSMFVDYLDVAEMNQHYSRYSFTEKKITEDHLALKAEVSMDNSYLLATICSFNKSEAKYVSGMTFANQINFFNIKEPEKSFCLSLNPSDPIKLSAVEAIPMPDKMEYYIDVCSTNDLIFALYANQNRKNWALNAEPGTIQVFDWDGIPKFQLLTKEKITRFNIDTIHKKMYGMNESEEVYVYDLSMVI